MGSLAFGSVGPPELILGAVILVLLFGARKLPELGSSVGQSIKNFRKGMAEANAEDDEDSSSESVDSKPADSKPADSK